jgi:hypothetical protein
MKKFAFALMLTAAAGMAETWSGTVSDAKCGAAHADASEKSMACANKCVKGGQKAVFVSDGKVYNISNPKKVAGHIGHKVEITGKMKGDTIQVAKLKMAS